MTTTVNKDSIVIWQETKNEDMPVSEPALVITPFSDTIYIEQEGHQINLNYGSLDEFCRVLRSMKKHNLNP
jgi:hypothetical protein